MKGTPMRFLLLAAVVLLAAAWSGAAEPGTRPAPKHPATKPARKLKLFDRKPMIFVVNGYSTSFQWPAILQRKLDRYFEGRRFITVRSAVRGDTPIARWIDLATGQPAPAWEVVRPALARPNNTTPVVVLAQQSLQWVYGLRTAGIRDEKDAKRIKIGADALETYARRLHEDGADLVFIAMHIYKKPMEPAIGNERLALKALMERNVPFVAPGPDVWTPTSKLHPKAFARDGVHPNAIGAEVMAQHWFAALLGYDGLEVPAWSEQEMQAAIEKGPAPRPRP